MATSSIKGFNHMGKVFNTFLKRTKENEQTQTS